MKSHIIALGICSSLMLSSCATFSTGSTSDAVCCMPAAAARAVPVTFSIYVINAFGPEAWVTEAQLVPAIQQMLQSSGQFSNVRHVALHQGGDNHLSFEVKLSGLPTATRGAIGFLGGLTFCTIPIWTTMDIDISMTAHRNGKQLALYNSQQANTEVIWAPLILAAPFCNHSTAREAALDSAMDELSTKMRADGLAQKFSN